MFVLCMGEMHEKESGGRMRAEDGARGCIRTVAGRKDKVPVQADDYLSFPPQRSWQDNQYGDIYHVDNRRLIWKARQSLCGCSFPPILGGMLPVGQDSSFGDLIWKVTVTSQVGLLLSNIMHVPSG